MKNWIVYDVEVVRGPDEVDGGWNNPEGMGFASAVAYDYSTDKYNFYLHKEGRRILIDDLRGKIAVTFNGVKFDSRVVLGNKREAVIHGVAGMPPSGLMHIRAGRAAIEDHWLDYDILLKYIQARFGYETVKEAENRLGDRTIHDGTFNLDALCWATLGGIGKTGHGAKAPALYQAQEYDRLLDYNLQDVRLTKRLFDFVRHYGYVIDGSGQQITIGRDA